MRAQRRRTKIVATIGPATSTHDAVRELVEAGVDAIRLNLSHGTHEDHGARARIVREVQDELGKPLALIADLQGPKLRIGDLEAPRMLLKGEDVQVVGEQHAVDSELPVAPAVIGEVLRPGHDILIDDGLVRLTVTEVDQGRAVCTVVVGGEVKSHKGVNLPGVPIPIPSLTKKDLDDLEFALGLGVDFVALSFVRAAADVRDLQAIIRQHGSPARVIAKIEKAEAIEALDEIIVEADAVMVARGDLGVEIGAATVPLLQKRIILECLEAGKPVITATQMLESMIEHAEPTRAEASDVANAVLDGTSAIMLSAETAIGELPRRGGADDGSHRARGRAVDGLPPRAAGAGGAADRRQGDVERRLRPGGDARRERDPRPDVHRPDRLGGRATAAAAADRRALASPDRVAADGARVGDHAGAAAADRERRGPVDAFTRVGVEGRGRGSGRPRRHHRGHGRQPAGLDERDQGRRRLIDRT